MEQASPLYSHKGSLSGGTPDTPVSESRRRSEIYYPKASGIREAGALFYAAGFSLA